MFSKFLILLSLTVISTNCFYYNDTPYLEFIKSDQHFLHYYNPWFNQTVQLLEILSNSNQISRQCKISLRRWTTALKDNEAWAIKFLESTGKSVNGKLVGRNVNFGSFEYCSKFYADPEKNIDFDGRYCMVSLQTHDSKTIQNLETYRTSYRLMTERSKRLIDFSMGNGHGLCVPSTCQIDELVSVTNDVLKSYGFSVMAPNRCVTRSEPEPWTNLQIASFAIISIFVSLCFLSSFIKNDFLSSFSLVDNFNIIYNFELKDDASKETVSFLHGAKSVMLVFSIMTHTFMFCGLYWAPPQAPIKEHEDSLDYNLRIFLERFLLFAGQMFFIGGFFSMYSWYDVIKSKAMKFNYLTYLGARFIRTAIIGIPILLLYFILPQLGNGPFYSDLTNHFYENCKENGYKLFSLTTNIGDMPNDMCNVGSWYLSADWQIYVINYLMIYYLVVKPKLGLAIAFGQMFLSNILTVIYNRWFNLPPFVNAMKIVMYSSEVHRSYFAPFSHYNQYALGVLCAYLVKSKIKPKLIDYKIVRIAIWIVLSTSAYYATFWYPHHLEETNQATNKYVEIFYPMIDKLFMTLMNFFAFYTASFGYFTIIRKFLSLKCWYPLSRLSFGISLSQFIYISYTFSTTRNSYTLNAENMQRDFLINFIYIFLLSNFIFLFVEGPLIAMLKKYSGYKGRMEAVKKATRLIYSKSLNDKDGLKVD